MSETADLKAPPAPDGPADMAGSAHCTSLGHQHILACKGSFTMGNFNNSGICPNDYKVCSSSEQKLLGKLDNNLCKNLRGFFAANIPAAINIKKDMTQELVCPPNSMKGEDPVLVGCGTEARAGYPMGPGTIVANNDCHGLKTFVPCNNNLVQGWSCQTGLGDATHTNTDRGGLLCCKN
ncbi:MAG: hypothetical protein RMK29_18400 [Myxococcales bacterium]|nr:hypothetical protein [Myxococcota bacterium]MDW8283680.1 hypothetical protein [Myxococcales bacterium]